MNQRRNIWERVVMEADLPGETLPGYPLVEIVGEERVLVENHQGVTAYSCHEICVKVRYGSLSICGNGLQLARMSRNQLVVTGRICGVSLHSRRK